MDIIRRIIASGLVAGVATLLAPSGPTVAQPFYEGKRLVVVVGSVVGGVADIDGRLIAAHLGRHIPGNPTSIVRNEPGASGVRAINSGYNVAQPDGLSIYQLTSGLYLQQLAGSSVVKFDITKMPIVGAWTRTNYALAVRTDKFKSLEDLRRAKEPLRIGTSGIGSGLYLFAVALQDVLEVKFDIAMGYLGDEPDLAVERGEVDGRTASVENILRNNPHWIADNLVSIVVVAGHERHPSFPNVPTAYEVNPNPGPYFETISEGLSITRPYVLPPQTPPDRVALLRKAWDDMLNDDAFRADVNRLEYYFAPVAGEKIEAYYKKVMTEAPPEVVAFLKKVYP